MGNLLGAFVVFATAAQVIAQGRTEFEVASIKRNISGAAGGETRRLPDGTFTATNISIRNLLPSAWPAEDREYRNLPTWAIGDRYDVTVKAAPDASPAQVQEMWRSVFRERFKLAVHEEPRDTPIYALVLARADGRLGPQIQRSPHDCAALVAATAGAPSPRRTTLPSEAEVMATCGSLYLQGRIIVGGTLPSTFATTLGASRLVDRLVDDRTGLQGYYAFTLTYAPDIRPGTDPPAGSGDAPSIFTALQEQLGLKLEPARKSLRTVVIDHIEPPSAN